MSLIKPEDAAHLIERMIVNGFVQSVHAEACHSLIADWHKRGEALEEAKSIVRAYASDNPKWIDSWGAGEIQDPNGAHAWLAALTPPPQPAEATPTPSSQAK